MYSIVPVWSHLPNRQTFPKSTPWPWDKCSRSAIERKIHTHSPLPSWWGDIIDSMDRRTSHDARTSGGLCSGWGGLSYVKRVPERPFSWNLSLITLANMRCWMALYQAFAGSHRRYKQSLGALGSFLPQTPAHRDSPVTQWSHCLYSSSRIL